jgi:hypothetical protein
MSLFLIPFHEQLPSAADEFNAQDITKELLPISGAEEIWLAFEMSEGLPFPVGMKREKRKKRKKKEKKMN